MIKDVLSYVVALAGFAVLGTALATPAAAQQGPKIAYIDSQRIIEQAPAAQRARRALEEDMAQYRAELQELRDELRTMVEDYQQQQATLSAEAKRAKQQAIREKQRALRQRARQLEQQAVQRQAEVVRPVMERINEVIQEIREQGGYAMIFDAAAGGIIAADPSLDITDKVLARLKATAQTQ